MRHHDDLGALPDQRLDGRREPLDPGRVGDRAVLDRHVQIGAQQHPFAAHIDVVEGAEFRHGATLQFVHCAWTRRGAAAYTPVSRESPLFRLRTRFG